MNSNKKVVPEAKAALDKFKMEVANEVGVNLKEGYNGDITAKQAGSIGGQMVNNICPVRTVFFTRNNRTLDGHVHKIGYEYRIVI
ncbi:MAG: alpha/beta-type small acid-soluble spore protein [Clostridia bacterium]|nr:alpha/beta-type small acid-soluble spore protein [Clostridia bacterium]